MDTDGADVIPVTSRPSVDATPEWSPDGTKLVFQRADDGDAVYTTSTDGSALTRLSSDGQDLLPSWSPDGKRIAFSYVVRQPSAATSGLPLSALILMNADGSDRTVLVATSAASVINLEPHFSPDGTKIAFE
jgi:Tol biopolymer transport system component